MTRRFNVTTLATGALVLAVGTACGGTTADPMPSETSGAPTSTPTTPATSPTSSTPPTPTQRATVEAERLVRRYFYIDDGVRRDSSAPLSNLAAVATGLQLSAEQHFLQSQRDRGLHQVGATKLKVLKVQSVRMDNSDPSKGKAPTVVIDACYDVANVDVVDKHGNSVVSSSRPNMGWIRLFVTNYHWASNPAGGWRVADGMTLKKSSC